MTFSGVETGSGAWTGASETPRGSSPLPAHWRPPDSAARFLAMGGCRGGGCSAGLGLPVAVNGLCF